MRILLAVHGFPPAANGGTEVYTRNLAAALAASGEDDVMVLTRENDPRRPDLGVRRVEHQSVSAIIVNNTFQSCHSFEESYANPAVARIAGSLLDDWGPDVVHLQHLTCLSTGIPAEAVRRSIPVLMTLNDYWLICHRGQLVDLDGIRCTGPFDGGCARCLQPDALAGRTAFRAGRVLRSSAIPGARSAAVLASRAIGIARSQGRVRAATSARLRHMQEAVAGVDLFLAPSRTLHDAFGPFGIPAGRIVRCDQGIPLRSSSRPAADGRPGPLRVGFAGGFLPTKGADVLLDAIDLMASGSVLVDLLGSSDGYHGEDDYARTLSRRLGHPAIRRLGPVPHSRMASIFDELDVMVVASTWIENAPFVIREAFASGVPVVASNLGGMAEMVRHGVDGWLFPSGDARCLAEALQRLVDDPALLEVLRSGIVRPPSIEEDAQSLRQVYRGLIRSRSARRPSAIQASEYRAASKVPRIAAVVLNYRTADQTWLAVRSLQTSRVPPHEIAVVDNASGDGSVDRLRQSLDDVRIVEAGSNRGFSGGCNIGIRAALAAGADHILLSNSDVVLAPDAIARLIAAMDAHPAIGIAAPVLLSREEPDQVSSAGVSFSLRTGRMRHRGAGRRLSALGPGPVSIVDAVSGCVMLIRRAVLERAGLLDEEYFFSFEDIELCLRARRAGFETGCVHDAVAYHEGGRTIGRRSTRRIYFATRNHLRLAAAAGGRTGRPIRSALVLGLNAAYVLMSPEAPLVAGASALVRGAWHHFRGRYGAD
jgi:GT2 family glycosyltransferase/glycosyltransferase involved in cell wall biosynthesis